MSNLDLSEQETIRRNSLQKLRELGINPYPANEFKVNTSTKQILEQFDPETNNFQDITIAGRLMNQRIMGKASFAELQDESGKINFILIGMRSVPVRTKASTTMFSKNYWILVISLVLRDMYLLPRWVKLPCMSRPLRC